MTIVQLSENRRAVAYIRKVDPKTLNSWQKAYVAMFEFAEQKWKEEHAKPRRR